MDIFHLLSIFVKAPSAQTRGLVSCSFSLGTVHTPRATCTPLEILEGVTCFMRDIEERPANYGLWDKSSLLLVFVTKLYWNIAMQSFTYYLALISC